MHPKKCVATGLVLLSLAGVAKASFLGDMIRSAAATFIEQQDVKGAPDCTLSADDALMRSIELLSDGRQADAEDLIKSAVKTHRDDIRILFAKGVLERSRWSKDAGQVWFALTRKADGNEALSRAAWLSIQLDQKKSGGENLDELIRLSDENPDDIYLLWLGAIQCREQTKVGSNLEIRLKQEVAELGRIRYELLFKHFELGPVMAHHTYANILTEDLGDYDRALMHRIKAVSMEAKNWTLEGFADTLTKMGKYRWACPVWKQAIKMRRTDARCHNRWGDALFALGKYEEATEKYREATRLRPKSKYYWKDLGDGLERLGKENKIEMFEAYQRAVELGYDWALSNLGWCYEFGHGVEKNEKKTFELYWLCADKTDSAFARYKLGNFYFKGIGVEKNVAEAQTYFEEAVKIDPNHSRALKSLAWFLVSCEDSSLHDYPRAIELAKRSIALDENKYNLDTLAAAYFKNEQYGEAVKAQERIIEFFQQKYPGDLIPERMNEKLEKYKKAAEELKEMP